MLPLYLEHLQVWGHHVPRRKNWTWEVIDAHTLLWLGIRTPLGRVDSQTHFCLLPGNILLTVLKLLDKSTSPKAAVALLYTVWKHVHIRVKGELVVLWCQQIKEQNWIVKPSSRSTQPHVYFLFNQPTEQKRAVLALYLVSTRAFVIFTSVYKCRCTVCLFCNIYQCL